jgi:hypothetical protein
VPAALLVFWDSKRAGQSTTEALSRKPFVPENSDINFG